MSCKYCGDNPEKILDCLTEDGYVEDGVEVSIEWGRLQAWGYHDDGHCCGGGAVPVSFCPMCGRKLRTED